VEDESEEGEPDDREACEEKLTQEITIVAVHVYIIPLTQGGTRIKYEKDLLS